MNVRLTAIVLIIVLASCQGSNKVVSANKDNTPERKKLACAQTHVDMNTPHIDWFEEESNVFNKAPEIIVLPKNYKVYSVDRSKLDTFFNTIKSRQTVTTALPLPSPAGCQLFEVKNNLKEGARIPPSLTMGLGIAQEQKAALSYNSYNGEMVVHIDWFGLFYEISPVTANNKRYYIVYEKEPPEEKIGDKQNNNNLQLVEYKPVK